MPGLMIHLMFAKRVEPKGSNLFYLGNIAPDAVPGRELKDITHFRTISYGQRERELVKIKKSVKTDFENGMFLHLYLDWKWDEGVIDKFREEVKDGWFLKYRRELATAGNFAYHNSDWAKQIWQVLESVESSEYGEVEHVTRCELNEFVFASHDWLKDYVGHESSHFSNKFVNDFLDNVTDEYFAWCKTI